MTSRLPLALALAGIVGCGLTSMAITANADPVAAQTTDQSSSDVAAPDHFKFSDADRAAFLEARIAALHAGLALTPAQEKLWPAVESALRDTHNLIAAQRAARRDGPRPADPVAWLQRVSNNTVERGEALKKLADAATPFYATLNDDQKHRLPFLLHAVFGHRFADNEGWHGREGSGWHNDRDGDHGGDFGHSQGDDAQPAPDNNDQQ
ncbi:MAG: Spy/CpxP family protein refolding chaperone [Pseudomonadota bacterium]